jgi:glutathione synthase
VNVLILTDHSKHSLANSVYALSLAIRQLPQVSAVRVASRGTTANADFFACAKTSHLYTISVEQSFSFGDGVGSFGESHLIKTPISWADGVVLRIPHPVPANWFDYLVEIFVDIPVVNNPAGIAATTSKAWLVNVAEVCPPLALCQTAAEVQAFAKTRDIVLKPLEGYGGSGVLRVMNRRVELDGRQVSLDRWPEQAEAKVPYLAMEYLRRVTEGDKRIVVVGDRVLGAALRLPADGQWLCNVSQGGRAEITELTPAEDHILDVLKPKMTALGVVMYGVDTLMGNDGHRVLSEVNTMSIGGLLDLPGTNGKSAPQLAAEGLVEYLISHQPPAY